MRLLRWLWSFVGGPPAPTPQFVVEVQAATVKACGFLPQAASVVQILGAAAGQPGPAATAVSIAGVICRAVTAAKSAAGILGEFGIMPTVEIGDTTIEIEGTFVEK